MQAARRLAPLDADLAREAYLEALAAAIFAGRLGHGGSLPRRRRGPDSAASVETSPGPLTCSLTVSRLDLPPGTGAAVVPLSGALDAFARPGVGGSQEMRWLWLACRVAADLWDDDRWHDLAQAVGLARDAGALSVLPIALTYRAGVHVHAGEFEGAEALIEEAEGIIAATGEPPLPYTSLVLAAWRGQEEHALQAIEVGVRKPQARGEGRVLALAGCFTAVLYNGLGRYGDALVAAQPRL